MSFAKCINELTLQFVNKLQLDPAVKEAFDVAYNNIYAFHLAQRAPEKNIENIKVNNYLRMKFIFAFFLTCFILTCKLFYRVSDAKE